MTFQHPNLNAHLIQNAPYSLHASKKNVKIHVSQQNVVLMLIAKPVITEHFVFVESDMLEILTISVKNVSYFFPFSKFYLLWTQSQSYWLLYSSLAGCKSDSECPLTQTCINRECVDPCPLERCGTNALCTAKNHRAVCSCPPGYRPDPDPYIRCKQYECLTDPECPSTLACQNEKCVDPCKCARNADCSARNHRGVCTCQPGFTGDPYGVACTPSKISSFLIFNKTRYRFVHRSNQCYILTVPEPVVEDLGCKMDRECPSKQACIITNNRGECKNPCTTFQPCVQNAECKVYDSLPLRTMTCTCIEGFTGKGDELCQKISKLL